MMMLDLPDALAPTSIVSGANSISAEAILLKLFIRNLEMYIDTPLFFLSISQIIIMSRLFKRWYGRLVLL